MAEEKTFKGTSEIVTESLKLWKEVKTDNSVESKFHVPIYTPNSIESEDQPLTFTFPNYPLCFLQDVDIFITMKILKDGNEITSEVYDLSCSNSFLNALISHYELVVGDMHTIGQTLSHSHAYSSYFNFILNGDAGDTDQLFLQNWEMDRGFISKVQAENKRTEKLFGFDLTQQDNVNVKIFNSVIEQGTTTQEDIDQWKSDKDNWFSLTPNSGLINRSQRLRSGKEFTITDKLRIPFLTQFKAIPGDLRLRLTMYRTPSSFSLIYPKTAGNYSIKFQDVRLQATYVRPYPPIHSLIQARIKREPIIYNFYRSEISFKPLSLTRFHRVSNVYENREIPSFAVFTVQRSRDIIGDSFGNPFVFFPFRSFSCNIDNIPVFNPILKATGNGDKPEDYVDFLTNIRDFYGVNYFLKADTYQLNAQVPVIFTPDKNRYTDNNISTFKTTSTVSILFELAVDTPVDQELTLICWSLYPAQIEIDSDNNVKMIS